jgi:hypothetical protein
LQQTKTSETGKCYGAIRKKKVGCKTKAIKKKFWRSWSYLLLVYKDIILLHKQGVSEISALILTGNRTHQKEQLFSLPFWRKTLRNGLKK